MQAEADGSVRHALMGVRSVVAEVSEAGRVEDAEYVPVQPELVGSVRQAFIGTRSVVAEVREAGRVEDAE